MPPKPNPTKFSKRRFSPRREFTRPVERGSVVQKYRSDSDSDALDSNSPKLRREKMLLSGRSSRRDASDSEDDIRNMYVGFKSVLIVVLEIYIFCIRLLLTIGH